eukprot:1294726-Heterocapsa_arctica.AAC.1
MVIARMPEDPSKAFKHRQKTSKTFKATYTCMCTPVGPTDHRPFAKRPFLGDVLPIASAV